MFIVYPFLPRRLLDWSPGMSDAFRMRKDNESFHKQAFNWNEHLFFFYYKFSYIKLL